MRIFEGKAIKGEIERIKTLCSKLERMHPTKELALEDIANIKFYLQDYLCELTVEDLRREVRGDYNHD